MLQFRGQQGRYERISDSARPEERSGRFFPDKIENYLIQIIAIATVATCLSRASASVVPLICNAGVPALSCCIAYCPLPFFTAGANLAMETASSTLGLRLMLPLFFKDHRSRAHFPLEVTMVLGVVP